MMLSNTILQLDYYYATLYSVYETLIQQGEETSIDWKIPARGSIPFLTTQFTRFVMRIRPQHSKMNALSHSLEQVRQIDDTLSSTKRMILKAKQDEIKNLATLILPDHEQLLREVLFVLESSSVDESIKLLLSQTVQPLKALILEYQNI